MDIAEYTPANKAFDTIHYKSIGEVATNSGIPQSTLYSILKNPNYNLFFSCDKAKKTIKLNTSFHSGANNGAFVSLTQPEVAFLREHNETLLCKYYIYLKYYCGYAEKKNIKQDFTDNQFLSAIGYSTVSNNEKEKLCNYRKLLNNKFIKIQSFTDDRGYNRNAYTLLHQ